MSALANLKPDDRAYFEHSFEVIQKVYQFKSDRKEIENYIFEHDLEDFLIWVQQPIIDVFGEIKLSLNLFRCWDENKEHLVLTMFSNLEDMDELTELEDRLFEQFDNYKAIDNALHYITIAQR